MNVPHEQRKKVQRFIRNFRRNPTSPGMNYEKIANAADANMRSVRIDQAYRAIVLKPDQGNVYVILWVDHHDDAYRWAERKRCVVHPDTGSLQVFSVDEQEYVEPREVVDDEAPARLFEPWRASAGRRRFIVGDGHQRIYRRPVVMKHCGINIVGRNRAYRLRINYRTTDEIRRFAVRLLEDLRVDDLDGGDDRSDRYKSLMHGQPPPRSSSTNMARRWPSEELRRARSAECATTTDASRACGSRRCIA